MSSPPAFGTASAQLQGTAADFQVAVPASVAADDIIVVAAFIDSNITVTAMPTGFANATNSPTFNNAGSGNHRLYVMWKRATGADAGTYDFTMSGPAYRNVMAFRYTGAITSGDPWDVTNAAIDLTDGTTSPPVTVTTTVANTLLVWNATDWAGGAWTPPTGFTERRDTGDRVASAADLVQAAAGSSGAVSGSCAGSGKRIAWLGALKPIPTGGAVAKDSSATYLANQYAGTLSAAGIPTLSLGAALCVKAGIALTNSGTKAANVLASVTSPQLLTMTGALNKAAGTTGLTIQQALYVLNGGTL